MNEELTKRFVAEEVVVAINQMHSSKAPGPDGMSPIFFQKHWNVIVYVKEKGSIEDFSKFFAIAWAIWHKRNQFIYEQKLQDIKYVTNYALPLQKEYKQVHCFDINSKHTQKVVRWPPPPTDYLKLNIDGAIFYNHQKAGIGCVLRDSHSKVIIACNKAENELFALEFIEATAMMRGLQMCIQWGVQKLIIETDCLILVNALEDGEVCLTTFDFLLQDIKQLMNGF